jgi:eukaryotic-like serine/threonine-protein kinase
MAPDPLADSRSDTALAQTRPATGEHLMSFDRIPSPEQIAPGERYTPVGLLGEGGFGEVTLVVDEVMGREVALKKLKAHGDADAQVHRLFAREALMQGRLEHPAIVPVYDLSRSSDGSLFFTMKRVRGRPLGQLLDSAGDGTDGRSSRGRLLAAFGQICLAAHFAHEHGVVHHDIKPDNIMVGDYGEVYLLDWGIAEVTSDREALDPTKRGEGQNIAAGTLGYMSPEQARGDRQIDRRADVYSLGAVLFELLTRRPLHQAATVSEMLRHISLGVESRPSVRAPEVDTPPELEAVCVKATALDPENRYQSARDLFEDIERYVEGDRDVLLRSTMSREHSSRAADLARNARQGAPDTAAHSEAMGAVSRALALDPTNREALRTLIELLTVPPLGVPEEAAAETRAMERGLDRARSRSGLLGVLFISTATTLVVALSGIHSVPAFVFEMVTMLGAIAASIVRLRRPRADGFAPTYYLVALSIGLVGAGVGFSSFVLVPTFAIVLMVGITLSMDHRRRYLPMVAGCIALILPLLPMWLQWLPRSSAYLADATWLPDASQAIPVLMVHLLCMIVACLFVVRFREALSDLQRRVSLNTWQLRQLLPKEAGRVDAPDSTETP